jgi:hypothetical protein
MSPAAPGEPFLWQLQDPAREIDLRPSAPGLTRTALEDARGHLLACPVFLGRANDPEVRAMRAALRRLGIVAVQIGGESQQTGLRAAAEGVRFLIGDTVVTPTVLWVRHFSARAARRLTPLALDRFREDSWRALLSQLGQVATGPLLGIGPGLLRQLAVAREVGIRMPVTVASTCPAADAGLIPSERVVLKALDSHFVETRPGRLAGIFAQIVAREEVARWTWSGGVPVVLQEHIEHEAEFRVYVLRGEVHGFLVGKSSPEAPWLDERAVRVTSCPVPDDMAAAARIMAARLGIGYAAFDFLVSAGEPVLLEASASGDWRWFETKAAVDTITTAAAMMTAGIHRGANADAPGDPHGRGRRLPLLPFLAG